MTAAPRIGVLALQAKKYFEETVFLQMSLKSALQRIAGKAADGC